jgi:hypothetical protein
MQNNLSTRGDNMGRFTLAVIALFTFATTAWAIPGLDASLPKPHRVTAPCTDFSGAWMGFCENSTGTKTEQRWHFEQTGCEYLSIDGNAFMLDGMRTSVYAPNKGFPSTGTVIFTWNAKKSELSFSQSNVASEDLAPTTTLGSVKMDGTRLKYAVQNTDGKPVVTCDMGK